MSVQTAIEEVQTAIYALLMPSGTIDSTLASLGVVGVFNWRNVTQNQAFDYITLGDITESPNNALGQRGYSLNYNIHIWSRYRGTNRPSAMVDRLNELLDQPKQPLTLATHTHVSTRYQRTKTYADPDGLTIHLIVQYEIFVQE